MIKSKIRCLCLVLILLLVSGAAVNDVHASDAELHATNDINQTRRGRAAKGLMSDKKKNKDEQHRFIPLETNHLTSFVIQKNFEDNHLLHAFVCFLLSCCITRLSRDNNIERGEDSEHNCRSHREQFAELWSIWQVCQHILYFQLDRKFMHCSLSLCLNLNRNFTSFLSKREPIFEKNAQITSDIYSEDVELESILVSRGLTLDFDIFTGVLGKN